MLSRRAFCCAVPTGFAVGLSGPLPLFSIVKSSIDPEWRNPPSRWNSDATDKIQAAIQEASDEGRTLRLRRTYTTGKLFLLPGTRIEGDAAHARFDADNTGAGLRRKRGDFAGYHLSLYNQTDQRAWNSQGVELYNFALFGDKNFQISHRACGGVSVSHLGGVGGGSFIPRHKVQGLEIRNYHGTGLDIGPYTRDSNFKNIIVYDCNGFGVFDAGVDGSRSNWNIGRSYCDGIRCVASAVLYSDMKVWGSGQYLLKSERSPIIKNEINGRGHDPTLSTNYFFWRSAGVTASNLKSQEAASYGFRLEGQGTRHLSAFIGLGLESDGDCRINSVSGRLAGINIYRAPSIQVEAFVGKLNPDFVGGPYYGIAIHTNSEGGRIALTTKNINSFPIRVAVGGGNNDFSVNGHKSRLETMQYKRHITPSWQNGALKSVKLIGDMYVDAPSQPAVGQRIGFIFLQDNVGGWVVNWSDVFKVSWSPIISANAQNSIEFVYDGTFWVQVGSAVGL
ncbi:hypothetical protein [Mongoliimonas terrestris]|uniref:hypothetical protein n=1 Tax=Mongoliimonas terrestris TaxID=1709001 RepID=UPI000B2B7B04|nr:hypothetical protein [Mongoliimonas terrestris]